MPKSIPDKDTTTRLWRERFPDSISVLQNLFILLNTPLEELDQVYDLDPDQERMTKTFKATVQSLMTKKKESWPQARTNVEFKDYIPLEISESSNPQ